jgi:ADP-heptose:LPS heptosyltransferase
MGDIFMVLPALKVIRQRYPEAQIDIITSKDGERVLRQTDLNITNYHIYDHRFFFRYHQNRSVKKFIQKGDYDQCFVFEIKPRYRDWFSLLPANKVHLINSKEKHASDYFLDSLGLSVQERAEWRNQKLIEPDQEIQKSLAAELKALGIDNNTKVIALHPSYSGVGKNKKDQADKVWPIDHWSALSKLIMEDAEQRNRNVKIICDLLPSEGSIAELIKQACDERVSVMLNPPNFKRYIALMDRIDLLIAPNTGSMHLAAALNTPVIGLFSGDRRPEHCGPYAPSSTSTILQAEDFASEQVGLARISPQFVWQQCQKFYSSSGLVK